MKKNKNSWNIRYLVDESFVPATQRIVLKIVRFQESGCLASAVCSDELVQTDLNWLPGVPGVSKEPEGRITKKTWHISTIFVDFEGFHAIHSILAENQQQKGSWL